MDTIEEQKRRSDRLSYRFTLKEKMEAVKLIESGESRKVVMNRYQISNKTFSAWMKRFSSTYQPASPKVYKPSEKRSVLRAIEQGMSINEAAVVFGVRNAVSIREWLKKAKAENAELGDMDIKKSDQKESRQEEGDLHALKQQLAEAQLKIKALETMIDVAEEHLKIDIRKKSGAKQSPK